MIDEIKTHTIYVGRIDFSTSCDDNTELPKAIDALEAAARERQLQVRSFNCVRVHGARYHLLVSGFERKEGVRP